MKVRYWELSEMFRQQFKGDRWQDESILNMSQFKRQFTLEQRKAKHQKELERWPEQKRENLTMIILQKHLDSRLTPNPSGPTKRNFVCQNPLPINLLLRKFREAALKLITQTPQQLTFYVGPMNDKLLESQVLSSTQLRLNYAEQDGFVYIRFAETNMRNWDSSKVTLKEMIPLFVFLAVMGAVMWSAWRVAGTVFG